MALSTRSVFYYGHLIDNTNFQLDFDEGSGEITAEINAGSYSLTGFAAEIERAMNAASELTQVYTVTVNRDTRIISISAPSSFSLLVSTGSHVGTSVFTLAGFTGADRASDTSHDGDTDSGKEYRPQFTLQGYIPTSIWRNPTSASVNVSSSGVVEVIRFGDVQFMECNIKWITDTDVGVNDYMDNSATAVADVIDFLEAATKKNTIEFMQDRDSRSTFETFILEKTPDSTDGVGYKLYELLNIKLPDWYETKKLMFRKLS